MEMNRGPKNTLFSNQGPIISSGDKNLKIHGYNIIREDHLFNSKQGRVCVYYLLKLLM